MREHQKNFWYFFYNRSSFYPLTLEYIVKMASNFQASCLFLFFILYVKIEMTEKFLRPQDFSKKPFFPKNEILVIFSYIWPTNLCKCGPNRLKIAEILHDTMFHTIHENEDQWISLKGVALLQSATFLWILEHFQLQFTP